MGSQQLGSHAHYAYRGRSGGGEPHARFFLATLPRFEASEVGKSVYPGIAALAAQIEMFGLSKRELEAKFTKSEMVLLAWRSQEMSHNMNVQTKVGVGTPRRSVDGMIPEGLPDHFFRKDYDPETGLGPGELDLRQVKGEEAYKFFSTMGVHLPIIGGR